MRACELSVLHFLVGYTLVTQRHVHPLRAPVALRIVGALAEGAIIEQGSNANGEYTRFANGLQICWRRNFSPTPSGDIHTWTFPVAFVSNPAIVTMGQWHSDEIWMPCINGYSHDSANSVTTARLQYQIRSMSGISYPYSGRFFDFVAIGKWK